MGLKVIGASAHPPPFNLSPQSVGTKRDVLVGLFCFLHVGPSFRHTLASTRAISGDLNMQHIAMHTLRCTLPILVDTLTFVPVAFTVWF